MVNYQNGKIYKIESFIGNCIYYGSTCQLLCQRMAKHRTIYRCEPHSNITSKQVLEYPDAKIYLVELYPCNSKEELLRREGYYIKNNDCVNKCVAGRTLKEYYVDNKERLKLYRENNKESITQKHKEYYIGNKEKIKLKNIKNKEKIKLRKTKQYTCDCGKTIQWCIKSSHNRSQKHIKYINSII